MAVMRAYQSHCQNLRLFSFMERADKRRVGKEPVVLILVIPMFVILTDANVHF